MFGGGARNPIRVLTNVLGGLFDEDGRITIPGFYRDAIPLTAYERKELARLPFNRAAYRKFLGVPELFGERGFTPDEQRAAKRVFDTICRTLDCDAGVTVDEQP